MKRLTNIHSLPVQMIFSFFILVGFTSLAIGIPAYLIIRNQLTNEAWAQINQGSRATYALYAARQSEISNLGTLTAQRPTLIELLNTGNQELLGAYLSELKNSAGFDLVVVCSANEVLTAYPERAFLSDVCQIENPSGYYVVSEDGEMRIWLLGAHPIEDSSSGKMNVIIGAALDNEFALQMLDQTGLEHTILINDQPIASSLIGSISNKVIISSQLEDSLSDSDVETSTFNADGKHYYAARFPLGRDDMTVEVALDVGDVDNAQRRLVWVLVGSIITITFMASAVGMYLARRISQPLVHLADSAIALSKGDFSETVDTSTPLQEVKSVAQALESARKDLMVTLTNLQKEKDWGDHLLESIVEGIVTLDEHNNITFFSPGAVRITGWEQEDVLHKHIDDIFKLADEEVSLSIQIPFPDQKQKIMVKLSDGRNATLAITGARLMPPEAGGAQTALVFRDISQEEVIHRLLGQFMSNVAHEFRTPLSAVAASVELLLDQKSDLKNEEAHELLISLHLGVLGLETLIDNLLESASIEAGRFRVSLRPSDLGNIIAEAIQTMDSLLKKYGQRFVVQLPPSIPLVEADPRRTVQVLVNLISNASKYGPADAEIIINVAIIDDGVRVSVTDQGPGIPPEFREVLFHRFTPPLMDDDAAKAGAGLGLSVVKAIIDAQGGTVGMDDNMDGGTTFWFTLRFVSE